MGKEFLFCETTTEEIRQEQKHQNTNFIGIAISASP